MGPMGELTEVASAKRAARGVLRLSPIDEFDDVRARSNSCVSFSWSKIVGSLGVLLSSGETVL